MRRGGIIQLVLIGVVAGAIATAIAVFVPWLPDPASKEAGRINFVYWFTIVICLFVFSVVAAILVYAMINFRVKDGDLSDGPPVHGHTMIEIIWTIIPTVLVTAVSIVSAIVLAQDSHAGKNPLVIKVYGEQFAWTFQYPNKQFYPDLHLPVGRGVKLEITSKDVLHSFWVPQFAQKQDAVPGQNNELVITPNRLGTFPVICTELCGLGHSVMRSQAVVMSDADWTKWYTGSSVPTPPTTGGGTGGGDAAVAHTFTASGCGACHVFGAIAGATGTIGPSLEKLKEDAAKAGQPLDAYIEKSITDPDAYIVPSYQPGLMPATFSKTIPKDQLDALVQYLAQHTN
ncbi:MAG TPA: cytochrome c oxidase subunit II [Gaiellaceae bacterium]